MLFAAMAFKFTVVAYKQNKKEIDSTENQDQQGIKNKNNFYLAVISIFVIGLVFGIQKTSYPLLLHDVIHKTKLIALLFWLDPVIVAICQLKLSNFFEKFHGLTVMALGAIFIAIGQEILANVSLFYPIIIASVVFIAGEMLFMPTSQVFCFESAGNGRAGLSVGVWRTAYGAGVMFGAPLAGWLMHTHGFGYAFGVGGVGAVFISISCFTYWLAVLKRNH